MAAGPGGARLGDQRPRLGGLVGGALYKAANTADSMIGHRTPRHEAFGWAAAARESGLVVRAAECGAHRDRGFDDAGVDLVVEYRGKRGEHNT